MTSQWHYTINGVQSGPVTSDELKKLASEGKLKRTDLVWKDGMKDWVNADSLKNLFSSPPPLPNQPPVNKQVEPVTVPLDNPSTKINEESEFFKKNELMGILLLASPWLALSLILLLHVNDTLVFITIFCATAGIVVFIDAKQLGIGDQYDLNKNGKRYGGPLACSIAAAGIWCFAYPAYLYGRKRKGARNLLWLGIANAIIICFILLIISNIKPPLPNVDSPEVAQTLKTIIIDELKLDPNSDKITIDRPIEIKFDEENQKRYAKTSFNLNNQSQDFEFTIRWLNAKKDRFYVEISPAEPNKAP